jgi:hypothetical protein
VAAGKRAIGHRRAGLPNRKRELWRDHAWRDWRRRVFDPLAADIGAPAMHPYDLRHAFCSLLIARAYRSSSSHAKPATRRR